MIELRFGRSGSRVTKKALQSMLGAHPTEAFQLLPRIRQGKSPYSLTVRMTFDNNEQEIAADLRRLADLIEHTTAP
jgi:hypothetical protein